MALGKPWVSHGIPLGRTRLQPRVSRVDSYSRTAGVRGNKLRLNCIDEPIDCGHQSRDVPVSPVSKGLDEPHTEAFALWTECDLYRIPECLSQV